MFFVAGVAMVTYYTVHKIDNEEEHKSGSSNHGNFKSGNLTGWKANRSTGWWTGPDWNDTKIPSYPQASNLSKKLLTSLHKLNDVNAMGFGHQYTNYQGQNWPWFDHWGEYYHSDVYNDTGDYPMVFGYDLQDIFFDHDYTEYVKWGATRGAVISFSWLADNPACKFYNLTDKSDDSCNAYNNSCFGMDILHELLPGGLLNPIWVHWLDVLSKFMDRLTFENGESIPFVFRLFHECTQKWYWWGTNCGTNVSMVEAWNYTYYYLQDVKGHKGILWEYAPSKPSQIGEGFEAYYPGDDQVDIISFDRYAKNETYQKYVLEDCAIVVDFAVERGKVATLAETGILAGIQNITRPTWFVDDFLMPIMKTCPALAYALTYTDFSTKNYWVPIKGETTYPGFIDFYRDQHSVFLSDSFWVNEDYFEHVKQVACSDSADLDPDCQLSQ